MRTTDDYLNDFFEKITIPFIYFPQNNIQSKKQLAIHIYGLSNNLVLLPTSWTLSFPAVLSGINHNQIEYIARYAPSTYKKQLLETIGTPYKVQEALEISRALDSSNDTNMQNQNRVKSIIQYIKDNRIAFEF